MMWITMLAGMVIVDTLGNTIAKHWSVHQNLYYLPYVAMACFIGTNTFWIFALKDGSGLARGVTYFGVSSALLGVLVGVSMYGEKLSVVQYSGIALGVLAITLLSFK